MSDLTQMAYKLVDKDYLELWKYFQNQADNVKEAMFKTLTWTLGFATAILAFIFSNLTEYDALKAAIPLDLLVIVAALAGLAICVYAWVMLTESGLHIQRNWDRANRCLAQVQDLDIVVLGKRKEETRVQKDGEEPGEKDTKASDKQGNREVEITAIWIRLQWIVAAFMFAFGIILIGGICMWVN